MTSILKKVYQFLFRRFVVLRPKTSIERGFASEMKRFYELLAKYNANVSTDSDMEKMQYTLLRENHVIEKGMSIKNPRLGFGQQKVAALIARLSEYYKRYGVVDKKFLEYPLDTVQEYIKYTTETYVEIPAIEKSFKDLCSRVGYRPRILAGGVVNVKCASVKQLAGGDFDELTRSRRSIRYLNQLKLPTREEINKALSIAQRTPSACNRQAWHTHVFQGKQAVELVKWQGGSRGFEEEMTSAILVTSDLKGFLWHEVHQVYVDGGLYAMNLINALHYIGFGTIPLSTGFEWTKLKDLSRFGIPENEVPIVIIGFGNLLDEFKVAVSARKNIDKTNVYHDE